MVDNELILLRNRLHQDAFRFDISPSLWKMHYMSDEKTEAVTILKILQNGTLRGYAIYSQLLFSEGIKAYKILDVCAEEKDLLTKLIDRIIECAVKENADFIYFTESSGKCSEALSEKGFFSFLRTVIMVVLLNPQVLFSSLSEEVNQGKTLKLLIRGFDPILLRVGEKGVMVAPKSKPDLTVTTDGRTFVNLLFGKTSFLRQLLKGRVSVSSLFDLPTAVHFFSVIEQKKWYIPPGDWL